MRDQKIKILFASYGLGVGGIEKCLINLVNSLDLSQYEITVAVLNPEYACRDELKAGVFVIPFEGNFVNTTDTLTAAKTLSGLQKVSYLLRYAAFRVAVKLDLDSWNLQKNLPGCYDIAIAYSHTGNVPQYVISKVKAKKKILWYHTLWGQERNIQCYKQFDRIVTVSDHCKSNFEKMYPQLSDRIVVLRNLYDYSSIQERSLDQERLFATDRLNIATVGRLSEEKGYELAVKTCEQLKNRSAIPFSWYWIGDGPANKHAREMIAHLHLEDCFFLLGNKSNPYPYMKQSDIYVQPSFSEAYCTTVIEAKTLKKAIVTSNVESFREQIRHMIDGVISENDPIRMADSILLLMTSKALREKLADNCEENVHSNEETLLRYMALWEELLSQ